MGPGGLGSLGLLLLWAATHTWYLSPPCVRVADAGVHMSRPWPFLLCPLSVSELGTPLHLTVYFPVPSSPDPLVSASQPDPGQDPRSYSVAFVGSFRIPVGSGFGLAAGESLGTSGSLSSSRGGAGPRRVGL